MAGTTTAMCTSFKQELALGLHNFNAQVTPTATAASGARAFTSASSTTGVYVGMWITGTSIPANTIVSDTITASAFNVSQVTTGTITAATVTISGDVYAIALVKVTPTGTYDATTTNYSQLTGNSDQVTGTGYTAGGFVWTAAQNTGVATSGTTAYWQFSVNPSWTSATITTTGAILYNQSARAQTNNRSVGVFDFGGTQTVTNGTFTIVLPTNNNTSALLRLT